VFSESEEFLKRLISEYGYWAIGLIIGIESIGEADLGGRVTPRF
jgi:hypothetical protein